MLVTFKSNTGIMFLASCAGLVLLNNLDPVVVTAAGAVIPGEGEAYVRLAVVLLSIVFAGLVFRGTTKGSAMPLSVLIAIILSLTLWMTLPEATGVSWLVNSTSSQYWRDMDSFRALIISAGFALSLIAVLTGKPKHNSKSKHKD